MTFQHVARILPLAVTSLIFLFILNMDSSTIEYFESINPLTRKIIHDTKTVKAIFKEKWEQFDEKRQDDILDDYFVHPDVREKYKDYEKIDFYPSSYPVLKVQMGEKIVVDETNDFWTWQDEFSGPFSWKTKSQQDLTLLDLEPEQMTKQSKTRRRNSRDLSEEENKKAPREFCVQEAGKSLWYSEFQNLNKFDFKKSYDGNTSRNELAPQSHTNGSLRVDNSPEAINYAFNRDSFIDTYEQKSINGRTNESTSFDSGGKIDKKGETSLNGSISKKKYDIEMSVFENPMMSQVAEDEVSLSSSVTSPSHRPLLKGYNTTNASPSRNPLLKDDSQESSSSAKSQLYEPENQKIERADVVEGNMMATNDKSQLVSGVDYEDTELIAVDVNTGMYSLNSFQGSTSSLNLPKTGFDFLDEW